MFVFASKCEIKDPNICSFSLHFKFILFYRYFHWKLLFKMLFNTHHSVDVKKKKKKEKKNKTQSNDGTNHFSRISGRFSVRPKRPTQDWNKFEINFTCYMSKWFTSHRSPVTRSNVYFRTLRKTIENTEHCDHYTCPSQQFSMVLLVARVSCLMSHNNNKME